MFLYQGAELGVAHLYTYKETKALLVLGQFGTSFLSPAYLKVLLMLCLSVSLHYSKLDQNALQPL